MDPKSNAMPVNSTEEGMELKNGKDLVVKCNGTEFSVNHSKKLTSLTDSAVQSTGNETARTKLLKVCNASGWKEPSYDFEEQGPPHNKLFTCKLTVHVESITGYTVLESFGEPKAQKKAAQEHAARGALWCLAHYGHVK